MSTIRRSGRIETTRVPDSFKRVQVLAIRQALIRTRGNKKEAALKLQISRWTIYRLLKWDEENDLKV